jgi:AcrR family transcriptional regulator
VATLHYYFPSKNDLILGISKYLAKQFVTVRAPAVPQTEHSALGWLRQGFADAEFYARSRPDLAVVTQELALRARRDRFVNEVMDKLIRDWRRAVRKMLELGIADGVFRCDIDLTAMVNLLAAVFSGVAYLKPHEIAGVGVSVEVLLIGKPL